MLSLDRKICEKNSAVQRRLVALAEAVGNTPPADLPAEASAQAGDGSAPLIRGDTPPPTESRSAPLDRGDTTPHAPFVKGELTVFVPGERDEKKEISEHLVAYSFGGPKWRQLWKMWRRGKKLLTFNFSLSTHVNLITVQDTGYVALFAYFLARRYEIPLEVQVHGLERFYGMRKLVAGFVLRRADKIRVVSERLRQELCQKLKVKSQKLYTLSVYAQIEVSRFYGGAEKGLTFFPIQGQTLKKRKTVPYPFTFLTVSRLVPVKNIALQIRAFARLVKEYPQARLRIVGDGPLVGSLKLQVASLKLEDKILFEGRQESVSNYYEEADAFLLTSDYEGWGLVALEAAAHRLPIIMTNVGLANEILHHDKEAIVIPVGDEEQLELAMKDIVGRPELRERLGKAAHAAFQKLPKAEEQIRKQVTEWSSLR